MINSKKYECQDLSQFKQLQPMTHSDYMYMMGEENFFFVMTFWYLHLPVLNFMKCSDDQLAKLNKPLFFVVELSQHHYE